MLSFKEKQKTLFKRKRELCERATEAEKHIQSLFDVLGVRYMFQKGFIEGDYYCIVDFYIPSKRLCIEVDGGYHNSPEQQKKDARKDSYLRNYRDLKVIRITNDVAIHMTEKDLSDIL